jgi:hypothetical protein
MSGNQFGTILTIVASGMAGGYAGHLAVLFPEPKPADGVQDTPSAVVSALVDIFIGVVAAFSVPAIISLTSSGTNNLMTKVLSGNLQADVLSLAGYCLIASYSARTFLQSILNQIKAD